MLRRRDVKSDNFCHYYERYKLINTVLSELTQVARLTSCSSIVRKHKKPRKLVKLGGIHSPSSEAHSRRKSGSGRSNEYVRAGASSREAMGQDRRVRVIEEKEIRIDNPIECLLSTESEVPFASQR